VVGNTESTTLLPGDRARFRRCAGYFLGTPTACQVSLLAVYLLATGDPTDAASYRLWQEWGIPLSVAYFMGDTVW